MFNIIKNNGKLLMKILGLTAIYELILMFVSFLFNMYPFDLNPAFNNNFNLLGVLYRWDSVHYLNLAISGYTTFESTVFFPLYIYFINLVDVFINNLLISGLILSWLCLAGGIFFFYKLLILDVSKKNTQKIILISLIFPASIFFSLIYTESLFLFLSLGVFYFLRVRKYLLATIFMALAVITRNIGVFLIPIYLLSLWQNNQTVDWKTWIKLNKKNLGYLILPILSLVGWLVFCFVRFGDAFSFIKAQGAWSEYRHFTWPWLAPKVLIEHVTNTVQPLFTFARLVVVEGGSFLLLLMTTIYFVIKKEWLYGLYCGLPLVLFSFFVPYYSVNRFIIVVFPIYIFLARILTKNDIVFCTYILVSFLCFIFNYYLFFSGFWVG